MPSDLVIEVAMVDAVTPHSNADRLSLAQIRGWQTIIRKDQFSPGDRVVFVPPDSTLPRALADELGVTSYLSERTDINGDRVLVVRQVRLRGEPSFGLIIETRDDTWTDGQDVADHFGIGKFEPPVKPTAGDAAREHPLFSRYTKIGNLRNFPGVFEDGESVIVTEKIHGSNLRIGSIDGELVAGSHRLQRKRPEDVAANPYWFPASNPGVVAMIEELAAEHQVVILYGEVYGSPIQKLHYGRQGCIDFVAFDLWLTDHFATFKEFETLCERFGIPTAPLIFVGKFSLEKIRELSEGPTRLDADHIREGVVVRPVVERRYRNGRAIMKYVSDAYLLSSKLRDAETTDV